MEYAVSSFEKGDRVHIRKIEKMREGFGTVVDILQEETPVSPEKVVEYFGVNENHKSFDMHLRPAKVKRYVIKRDGDDRGFIIIPKIPLFKLSTMITKIE